MKGAKSIAYLEYYSSFLWLVRNSARGSGQAPDPFTVGWFRAQFSHPFSIWGQRQRPYIYELNSSLFIPYCYTAAVWTAVASSFFLGKIQGAGYHLLSSTWTVEGQAICRTISSWRYVFLLSEQIWCTHSRSLSLNAVIRWDSSAPFPLRSNRPPHS